MSKDERDIYSKPGHLIRRLQQIGVAIFMAQTEGFGITPVQYSALLAIRNNPGIDQTTLTDIIAFDRTTIGDVVERLETKQLVRRVPGKNDRRTKLLYFTPAGRELLSKMKPHVESTQRLILAPLSSDDRKHFMRIMRKLDELNNFHSRVPLRLQPTAARLARVQRSTRRRRKQQ
jgi:DNA-binding MarR family transcriptional regulator